jgi:periplasmic protein TonB
MQANPLDPKLFHDHALGLRVLATIVAGFVIAGALTWFMYALIQFTHMKSDDTARVQILDFVRLQRDESSQRKDRKPEKPKVEKAPPTPSTPDNSDMASNLDSIGISAMPTGNELDIGTGDMGFGSGEGEFLPIVKVAPIYPVSAAQRGIEGECTVEYTVTTTGATRDIYVVEDRCDYSGFKKPSIVAASRFKYKPRVINGEAVEVHRVRNIFIFMLDKDGEQADE